MSKTTLKYYTVISDSADGLDDNVNEKLQQGWALQGGVSVCVIKPFMGTPPEGRTGGEDLWYTYAQAMTIERD